MPLFSSDEEKKIKVVSMEKLTKLDEELENKFSEEVKAVRRFYFLVLRLSENKT